MDLNLTLTIASMIIGVIGVGIAIHQTLKAKRIESIVMNWGGDISTKLLGISQSFHQLNHLIESADSISWGQQKQQIEFYLADRSRELEGITQSMHTFLNSSVRTGQVQDANQ